MVFEGLGSRPDIRRRGLDPWVSAELPAPPVPRGIDWLKVVGPGVIVLGVSIGGGEFLLGPAAFVRYGLTLLWVVPVAIVFQTIFNTEVMRYTMATGEPVFTGFMRTAPSPRLWAWVYAGLYFLQIGWPGPAGTAAAAIFFLFAQRLPEIGDTNTIYLIAVTAFLVCVAVLSIGRRVERTLELLNWVLVVAILGGFLVLAILFVPAGTWLGATAGLAGFDPAAGQFVFFPAGVDLVLIAALAAYAGSGGVVNLTLSNWARDKGYGMAQHAGYIPAAVGGKHVHLAHTGFTFGGDAESMRRWRGWWRLVRADQWVVFCGGAILGMMLPALLYVTFLPPGSDLQNLAISAALAFAIDEAAGPIAGGALAFLGAWLLFKTQLDLLDGMVRTLTDLLWSGSRRVRAWRGGDIRMVYYGVMAVVVIWAFIALRLAQPIMLLIIAANVAGAVFVISSLHLLYINTRLLPAHVRPPLWRRVALVGMAVFYGFFVTMSVRAAIG